MFAVKGIAGLLAICLLAGGCGSDNTPPEPATAAVTGVTAEVVRTWTNQTGLAGPDDLTIWMERMSTVCAAPVWELDETQKVAAEYIQQDGGSSTDETLLAGAASALWIIAAQVCPESFPEGALDKAPFAFRS